MLTGWAKARQSFYIILFVSALVGLLQLFGVATVEGNVLVLRINIENWFNPAYLATISAVLGPLVPALSNALGWKVRQTDG